MPVSSWIYGEVLTKGDAPTITQHENLRKELRDLRGRAEGLDDRLEHDENEFVQTRKVHEKRLKRVDESLDALDSRLSAIEQRLKSLEERITSLTKRTNGVEFEKEVEAMFSRQFSRAKEFFSGLEKNSGSRSLPS